MFIYCFMSVLLRTYRRKIIYYSYRKIHFFSKKCFSLSLLYFHIVLLIEERWDILFGKTKYIYRN